MSEFRELHKSRNKRNRRALAGNTNDQDHPTVLGLIGSFFFPLTGAIAYFRIRDRYPRAGKAYGSVSLVSFMLIIVTTVLNTPKTPTK